MNHARMLRRSILIICDNSMSVSVSRIEYKKLRRENFLVLLLRVEMVLVEMPKLYRWFLIGNEV